MQQNKINNKKNLGNYASGWIEKLLFEQDMY